MKILSRGAKATKLLLVDTNDNKHVKTYIIAQECTLMLPIGNTVLSPNIIHPSSEKSHNQPMIDIICISYTRHLHTYR